MKGAVLLPGTPHVFEVARERSIKALTAAHQKSAPVFVILQRDEAYDPPAASLFPAGTIAEVQSLVKIPSQAIKVTLLGSAKAWLRTFAPGTEFNSVGVEIFSDTAPSAQCIELMRAVKQTYDLWTKKQKTVATPFGTILVPAIASTQMQKIGKPGALVDAIGSYIPMGIVSKQKLLELTDPMRRLELLLEKLQEATAT